MIARLSIRRAGLAASLALLLQAGAAPRDPVAGPAGPAQPGPGRAALQPFEDRPGGVATVPRRADDDAFAQPAAGLGRVGLLMFKAGNGLFRKLWLPAPSEVAASDGLGPLYNARACERCHIRDGRGHPPAGPDADAVSLVLRISVQAPDGAHAPPRPDPVYGAQLQDVGLPGIAPEYRLSLRYEEFPVPLAGGDVAMLRRPRYMVADPGYGPLAPGAMLSPRVAPQMIGLGLLEAIPASEIEAMADPGDSDGDGISGRVNIVRSAEHDAPMPGRFGHKAAVATVREQSAAAFSVDMGLSSPLFPASWGDCTAAQVACRAAPHGAGAGDARGPGVGKAPEAPEAPEATEVGADTLDLVAFYARNLGVPARVGAGAPQVLHGKALFHGAGCAACHRPAFVTGPLRDRPDRRRALIWPYTDLLLHDMGAGLADHRPEGRADGREWRTAPLWGIGLTARVSGRASFLHDGRARTLAEAILWHGGEAAAAQAAFRGMPASDRAALLRFLESL